MTKWQSFGVSVASLPQQNRWLRLLLCCGIVWKSLTKGHMTVQSSSLRFADQTAKSPYAFPGGYPKFAVTSDGACLCPSCCKTERELIGTATGDDGWCVIGIDLNFEDDSLFCDHCSGKIECAYAS